MRPYAPPLFFLLILLLTAGPTPLGAQLLPRGLPETVQRLPGTLQDRLPLELPKARDLELAGYLRRHRDVIDTDRHGAPVVRSEVVAIDPTPDALRRAREAGFITGGEQALEELGLRVVLLRSPRGVGTRSALRRLRRMDPAGTYDFNHLYFGSGTAGVDVRASPSRAAAAADSIRVGLIDSGVAAAHPALASVDLRTWGCAGARHPDAHGTAVASLLAGNAPGDGVQGSILYAADIYCGRPTGGAVTGFAQAMAWMARERVAVVNLSLVGPHNLLLERATRALADRGHVLVAAVGNDGPAAAPLYPAAYPGVIGVTAVDQRQRALPEAGRGAHVDFAATGSELRVARPEGGWGPARGTSFAAPLVARAAARLVQAPHAGDPTRVQAKLAELATDLGARGRDDTYGHGWLRPATTVSAIGSR